MRVANVPIVQAVELSEIDLNGLNGAQRLNVLNKNSLNSEEAMLTGEQNKQLAQVGPGTPVGELFRRYWHPVAPVSQMKERNTFQVKILGEDLSKFEYSSALPGARRRLSEQHRSLP
jgi:hypothetical protein